MGSRCFSKRVEESVRKAKRCAVRRTTAGAVNALMEERAFWSRRLTIATNKLADVQRRLDTVTTQMAEDRLASDLETLTP